MRPYYLFINLEWWHHKLFVKWFHRYLRCVLHGDGIENGIVFPGINVNAFWPFQWYWFSLLFLKRCMIWNKTFTFMLFFCMNPCDLYVCTVFTANSMLINTDIIYDMYIHFHLISVLICHSDIYSHEKYWWLCILGYPMVPLKMPVW